MHFQFDSTIDGKAVKIASMIDEHTRESLLHLVERSITAERLVLELEDVFDRVGGPPIVLHMDNGPELISQALQRFCDGKVGLSYIPPGTPWNNGYTTAPAIGSKLGGVQVAPGVAVARPCVGYQVVVDPPGPSTGRRAPHLRITSRS